MLYAWQMDQLVAQKMVTGIDICHHDMEKIVPAAGNGVALNHLLLFLDRLFKCLGLLKVEGDLNKDIKCNPKGGRVNDRGVARYDPRSLQVV